MKPWEGTSLSRFLSYWGRGLGIDSEKKDKGWKTRGKGQTLSNQELFFHCSLDYFVLLSPAMGKVGPCFQLVLVPQCWRQSWGRGVRPAPSTEILWQCHNPNGKGETCTSLNRKFNRSVDDFKHIFGKKNPHYHRIKFLPLLLHLSTDMLLIIMASWCFKCFQSSYICNTKCTPLLPQLLCSG